MAESQFEGVDRGFRRRLLDHRRHSHASSTLQEKSRAKRKHPYLPYELNPHQKMFRVTPGHLFYLHSELPSQNIY